MNTRPGSSSLSNLVRVLGGLAFVWAGIVVGIAFIEAPIKFTAPSLTLPVGLDVGRHVFSALNVTECFLAILSVGLVWRSGVGGGVRWAMALVWVTVLLQAAWLLPALDARAALVIAGGHPAASTGLHLLFGLAEGLKVLALLTVGTLAYKTGLTRYAAETRFEQRPTSAQRRLGATALSHAPITDP